MKTYNVYCLYRDEEVGGFVEQVTAQENAELYEIKGKVRQELGSGYSVLSVVSDEWCNLLNKYNELFQKCLDNNLFEQCSLDRLGCCCCGYNIDVNSVCNYGRVILDNYNQLELNIEHLGIEQFENVITALEELFE